MQPGRLRYKATRIGLPFVGQAPRLPAGLVTAKPVGRSRMGGKFEVVAQASRLHAMLWCTRPACMQPGRLRYKPTRIGLPFVGQAPRLPAGLVTAKPVGRSRMGGKFEIQNSKFEIL